LKGTRIQLLKNFSDGNDMVQAEARFFQEAERLHKMGRSRKGTQLILSHGVAPANQATEQLMRDMHPMSRGQLQYSKPQVQQEIISPETAFANITSSSQRKYCTN
jgi:hypothetical protein